jgi:hypothetical protein
VLAPPVTAVRAKATGGLHGSAAAAAAPELPGRLRTLLKILAGQRVSEWVRLRRAPVRTSGPSLGRALARAADCGP